MNGKMTMSRAGLVTTILVIALGVYDLIEVLVSGTGSSVSNFLIQAGFRAPLLVFAIGFVCGHLFGYMKMEVMSGVSEADKEARP